MTERWQQWMPFYIDRWRGSAHVQAMKPAARSGYLYLLASAWQSADCTLPDDDTELAVLAGYTTSEWSEFGVIIRRRFSTTQEARLVNLVELEEWTKARQVFLGRRSCKTDEEMKQARTEAGQRGAAARWNREESMANDAIAIQAGAIANGNCMANDAITGTVTSTGTKNKDRKTSASTAIAVPAARGALLGTLPLNQGEYEVRADDYERDAPLYPALDVKQEYRGMKSYLLADPRRLKTKTGIRRFMAGWLARAQNSKRTTGGTNGTHRTESLGNRKADAANATLARYQARVLAGPDTPANDGSGADGMLP